MEVTTEQLATAIGQEASDELESALRKIKHCLRQLSDDQIWSRSSEDMNSIANLLLHLAGNVRQWIVSGVGGAPDHRHRAEEFNQRDRIPREELVQNLESVVVGAQQVMVNQSAAELLRRRCIQGFDVSGLQAIFESVAHFRGHTQEIVQLTRIQLGQAYEFDFVPATPEQGAP